MLILASAGCGGEATRREDCKRFNDWSSAASTKIRESVPAKEVASASTLQENAAWRRRRARAYEEASREGITLRVAALQKLAEHRKKLFAATAVTLSAEADAWEKGDHPGVQAQLQKDTEISSEQANIDKEWVKLCAAPTP